MRPIARSLIVLLLAVPFAATCARHAQAVPSSVLHSAHRTATAATPFPVRFGKMQTALR
jgi:hypothetical protein